MTRYKMHIDGIWLVPLLLIGANREGSYVEVDDRAPRSVPSTPSLVQS